MKRLFLLAGVASAAVALVVVGVTSASSTGKTLHLKGTRINAVQPVAKAGSVLIQTETVTGDDSGRDAVTCTVTNAKLAVLLCNFALALKGGEITSAGLVDATKKTFDIAVNGGTGSYNGASGTITVTNTSTTQTDYVVKLS